MQQGSRHNPHLGAPPHHAHRASQGANGNEDDGEDWGPILECKGGTVAVVSIGVKEIEDMVEWVGAFAEEEAD